MESIDVADQQPSIKSNEVKPSEEINKVEEQQQSSIESNEVKPFEQVNKVEEPQQVIQRPRLLEPPRLFTATLQLKTNLKIDEHNLWERIYCTEVVPGIMSKFGQKKITPEYTLRVEDKKARTERKTNKGKKKEAIAKPKKSNGVMNAEVVFDVIGPDNKKYYVSLKRGGCIRLAGIDGYTEKAVTILQSFIDYLKNFYPMFTIEKEFSWIIINYQFTLNISLKINLYRLSCLLDEICSKYVRIGINSLYEYINNYKLKHNELITEDDMHKELKSMVISDDIGINVNVGKLYNNFIKWYELNEDNQTHELYEKIWQDIIDDYMFYYVRNKYESSSVYISFDFYNKHYREVKELLRVLQLSKVSLFEGKVKPSSKKKETPHNIKIDKLQCTSENKFLIKGLKNPQYADYIHNWMYQLIEKYKDQLISSKW
jgi:hypothetical protein